MNLIDVLSTQAINYLPSQAIEYAGRHLPVAIISVLLSAIVVIFIGRFVVPANRLRRELSTSIAELRQIRERLNGNVVELGEISSKAMRGPTLGRLWNEYLKTLHPQREEDASGQIVIVRWRATTLAEMFFTEQAIVDTRLRTEFHKHLPGIMTGLGIIGTFSGLILGLVNFNVSKDPGEAQEQLNKLVISVGHAFIVSGLAIALAMIFTWIEKSLITSRYRQVEALRESIDSLFQSGAGEEYLERLAVASETSATQAAHIKDALVADLKEILTSLTTWQIEAQKEILTSLTTKQIEAQSHLTGQMSSGVSDAIGRALTGPMEDIRNAVNNLAGNQGDAVNRMLTDVLTSFAAQMRDMFGGQMRAISDLLQKTNEATENTAQQFAKLLANMDQAGIGVVDAMGDRLNRALDAMENRQQAMNTQMGQFVEQIKVLVSSSQSELQDSLSLLGDQVTGIITQLREQAENDAKSQGQRHRDFADATGQAMATLSDQVVQLLSRSAETNRALQDAVGGLANSTNTAIAGLNSGAETLMVAASDFAKAGGKVAETMRASATAVETLRAASNQIAASMETARGIFEGYARTSDTFGNMVTTLKTVIDNASREASVTSELIAQIKSATAALVEAQRETEDYLNGVSATLIEAHNSFAENVERSLREGNRQFQTELTQAVQLLSGAIKLFGDTVDTIPSLRQ
jgi:ABC-type transporter Mla subunit MlaD